MNKRTGTTLYFYQDNRLHFALGASSRRALFRIQNQALAERQSEAGNDSSTILGVDAQGSVVQVQAGQKATTLSYTAFGYSPAATFANSLAGFDGERPEPITGCYPLGNGYRFYAPSLMRFYAPDNMSPFGHGGYHSYLYCGADPVNFVDRTGHMRTSLSGRFNPTTPSISVRKTIVRHKRTLETVKKQASESRAEANAATELANLNYGSRIVANRLAADATTPATQASYERIARTAQRYYDRSSDLAESWAAEWHRDNDRVQHLSQQIAALERFPGTSLPTGDQPFVDGQHEQTRMITIRTGNLPKLNLLR
ncbi:hypothetical protein PS627_03847 [Pseudomonas fluorescens]|uniref:RHS repeat-associated core domain-containing protein n=1 Tax=Pseudomonas fluorescens TaxID=294 RepID=UPI001251B517|nr:RHS repeat-associated core domain-containing protein [Pseudomonas fluorescens]CAG8870091.1 hypothetical protein PS627_03847 [Pseudomonas fluorescens]